MMRVIKAWDVIGKEEFLRSSTKIGALGLRII
jgi:hypothetical protein